MIQIKKRKNKIEKPLLKTKYIYYYQLLKKTISKNKRSFFIGLTTFIIISIIGINFYLKNFFKQSIKKNISVNNSKNLIKKEENNLKIKKHKVKEDESLWQIAEKYYGSGFNAYEIALANKINNPNIIYKDQELIIPNANQKTPTKGEIISNKTDLSRPKIKNYIVKEGDYLWKIAIEQYGDGYAWIKIASYNKIINPNIIEPGMSIILP